MFDDIGCQAHDGSTLPLLRRNGASQPSSPHPSDNSMTWRPSATRSDVIRMIRRYKEREFSIPSAAGRIAIDETRVVKRRDGSEMDIMAASWVEVVDAARNWQIRQAVTAPPERRTDVRGSEPYNCNQTLRCVAPRRSVASIVKPKSKIGGGMLAADSDIRAWRDTVTSKLARIPRVQERALLAAEDIRVQLLETGNRLAAARSELQRVTGGRKRTKSDLSALVVTMLADEERTKLYVLRSIVHSDEYHFAVDNLIAVCTVTRDLEEYCFRMAA